MDSGPRLGRNFQPLDFIAATEASRLQQPSTALGYLRNRLKVSLPKSSVGGQLLVSRNDVFSLAEIKQSYPEEWVAIAVRTIDADGLPSAGVVLVHDSNEQFVWPALKLGESDDLIHVFFTGVRKRVTAAA